MITESDLGNILVRQKDTILGLIADGAKVHQDMAMSQLVILAELWVACDYGYKLRELLCALKDTTNRRSHVHWDCIILLEKLDQGRI